MRQNQRALDPVRPASQFDGTPVAQSCIQNAIVSQKIFEAALTIFFKKARAGGVGSGIPSRGRAPLCNDGDAPFKVYRNAINIIERKPRLLGEVAAQGR
jgi:hypothetical protein